MDNFTDNLICRLQVLPQVCAYAARKKCPFLTCPFTFPKIERGVRYSDHTEEYKAKGDENR